MICKTTQSIEAHHLLKPWQGGRGMGMKAGDQNAVPLCATHHRELHHHGDEFYYFESRIGDRHAGKMLAMRLWLSSPFYRSTLDD